MAMKTFACRSKGVVCDFVARAPTAEQVIDIVYPHAIATHDCHLTREEFAERIRDDIHDERRTWVPWARRGE